MKRMIVAVLAVSVSSLAAAAPAMAQTAGPKPRATGSATTGGSGKAATTTPAKPAPTASVMTEDEKALFALGAQMGEQARSMIGPLKLTPAEIAAFKKGMVSGISGEKSPYALMEHQQRLQARAEAGLAREMAAVKEKGEAFRAAAAGEPGATKTASGLVFRSLQPGQGEAPKAGDVVRVNYRGTLVDGTEFDASRGEPASFQLTGVIPCWTEGLQLMKAGEKARLVCPPEIAYGDRAQGRIPAGSTLVFEVELVGIAAGLKSTGATPQPPSTPATPRE